MIWLIGGTKDSRVFLEKILTLKADLKKNIIVSTATEYGKTLLDYFNIKVAAEKMDAARMLDFIEENKIETIVDFSHPYAFEVSKNAIAIAEQKAIKYYRYEREEIKTEAKNSLYFYELKDIVDYVAELEDNILVTLGSNSLEYFKDLKNLKNIYFRILPKSEMIKKCEDLGILAKNIIAMQGPFSIELNVATMKQYNIKYMITKKSGNTGGEQEKQKACDEIGTCLINYVKKEIIYPNCYQNIDDLVKEITKF